MAAIPRARTDNLDHRQSYATRLSGAKPWGGVESNGKTLVSSADCKTGDEVATQVPRTVNLGSSPLGYETSGLYCVYSIPSAYNEAN
jgi:hypothetical protein